MGVKNYPSDSIADSTYSPFSVISTSQKFDTRARGRYANVKIENENAGRNMALWNFSSRCSSGWEKIMAKIVVRLPEPRKEYTEDNQDKLTERLVQLSNN